MEINLKQAAQIANVIETTIKNWVTKGKIQGKKENNIWQVDRESLENHLKDKKPKARKNKYLSEQVMSQIVRSIITEAFAKLESKETKAEQSIQKLEKENELLWKRISELQNQIETPKSNEAKLASNANTAQAEVAKPVQKQTEVVSAKSQTKVDETKGEAWVRNNVGKWFNEVCPFRQANGRTWKQLAENFGEKIAMKDKGQQSPRAYLHALESWEECKGWARIKAKVALEIVPSSKKWGNHYTHPAEIGG